MKNKKWTIEQHPKIFKACISCLFGVVIAMCIRFVSEFVNKSVVDIAIAEENHLDNNAQIYSEQATSSISEEVSLVVISDTPNSVATLKQDMFEITETNAFIPEQSVNQFYHIISTSLPKVWPDEILSLEEKINFRDILADQVKNLIATSAQATDEEINGNTTFTELTLEANLLEEEMKESGYSIERVSALIDIRERALDICKVRDLLQMLSNDFQRLGRLYNSSGQVELAYEAYMTAIMYRVDYISYLTTTEHKYYYSLYHLGSLFHNIGDLSHLDYTYRENAFYLSEAFFWLGSNYDYTVGDYHYLGIYYAAMTNHKLIAFYDFYHRQTMDIHILEAEKYYLNAKQLTVSPTELSNIDEYLDQIDAYREIFICE